AVTCSSSRAPARRRDVVGRRRSDRSPIRRAAPIRGSLWRPLRAATHPSWYVNLARRPDGVAIEVDGRRFAVNAQSLHGAERERAWARIVALAPGYGKYAEQTDREIPIVRLTRKP